MKFRYRNAKGEEQLHTLSSWSEEGGYITGYCVEAAGPRRYLKFRVLEYLDGSADLLQDPYTPAPQKPDRRGPPDSRPQILFTGFPKIQRADLERRADEAGLRVMKSRKVTEYLDFLCWGPTAGPVKVSAARAQGVLILRQDELLRLCETGEMPDPTGEGEF